MSAPDQDLREWLKIATDKLTPPARERIWSEIQAHFVEAVEDHIGDGYYESFARKAALRELGDAEIAAKRFRKQHLTEKETELIGRVLKSAHNPGWFSLSAISLTAMICVYHFPKFDLYRDLLLWTLMCLWLVYPIRNYLVAKSSDAKHVIKRLLLLELVAIFSLVPLFIIGFIVYSPPYHYHWFNGFCFLPSLIKEIPRLMLWLKLRRIEDISVEMPRRDRVAS